MGTVVNRGGSTKITRAYSPINFKAQQFNKVTC